MNSVFVKIAWTFDLTPSMEVNVFYDLHFGVWWGIRTQDVGDSPCDPDNIYTGHDDSIEIVSHRSYRWFSESVNRYSVWCPVIWKPEHINILCTIFIDFIFIYLKLFVCAVYKSYYLEILIGYFYICLAINWFWMNYFTTQKSWIAGGILFSLW